MTYTILGRRNEQIQKEREVKNKPISTTGKTVQKYIKGGCGAARIIGEKFNCRRKKNRPQTDLATKNVPAKRAWPLPSSKGWMFCKDNCIIAHGKPIVNIRFRFCFKPNVGASNIGYSKFEKSSQGKGGDLRSKYNLTLTVVRKKYNGRGLFGKVCRTALDALFRGAPAPAGFTT